MAGGNNFGIKSTIMDYDFTSNQSRTHGGKDIPTNDLDKGWDGNFKGKPMPTGVYVFVAKLVAVDGKTETVKGEVHLLR